MRNPSPRIHNKTPYKFESCRLFQRNKCYRGENCRFAHTLVSNNRNSIYKSQPCYWSFNGIQCPFSNCHFLHKGDDECMPLGVRNWNLPINETSKNETRKEEEYSVLKTSGSGTVLFYKTKLCDKWERSGWCSYGFKCTYAHGQAELDAHTKKLYLPEMKTPTSLSVEKVAQAELDAPVTKMLYLTKQETHTKKLQIKSNSWMGWSAEKIGRVYGDWIDSMYVMQCPTT